VAKREGVVVENGAGSGAFLKQGGAWEYDVPSVREEESVGYI